MAAGGDRVLLILEKAGHNVSAPTLTGLAERSDLLSRDVNLSTHIDDIVRNAEAQEAAEIVLVGHSYGGFPATAAAHRLGAQVKQLILLDAFLPFDGEMFLDHAPSIRDQYRKMAKADANWHIPPLSSAAFGVEEQDQYWVDARLTPHPVGGYFERVSLDSRPSVFRKTYLRCSQAPGELLQKSVGRVKADAEWGYLELDAPHDAIISHPHLLSDTLLRHVDGEK
ncbi:alpha/beta fold hydrolase [Agrobacterium sp. AGB01]|uniref:alpha/beta fold hydrolase n=1 Tax=Agrobacterium sp. AGB01 TaxID=2769302 RepID=UPI00177FFEB6|nr:alpha/beta fold hydrolase [Agrobacterium sp. AGB01]